MKDITEVVNKALRDAFEEFESTYEKTEVKKQAYHLVTSTNELKRVLYVIPPDNCKSTADLVGFINQVTVLLTSKNTSKVRDRNVELAHIVKKLPGEIWTKEFMNVKTSASSTQKQTVKVVLDSKPMGTVAVVLKSAVYAYLHLNETVKKKIAQPPVPASKPAGPNLPSAQPIKNRVKIIIKKPSETSAQPEEAVQPPEVTSPIIMTNSAGTRFKYVPSTLRVTPTGPKSVSHSLSAIASKVAPLKKPPVKVLHLSI